jgi:CBS domain-containing protein
MKVKDLMSRSPITLDPEDNVGLAAETMRWANVRHLPVLSGGIVVGIVSEHDVLGSFTALGDLRGSRRPVRDMMKSPVETIGSEADASDAAAQMAARRIGCLPVLERGRLVGIVTVTDVLGGRGSADASWEVPGVAGLFARDVMRPHPETVRPGERVLDAAPRMAEKGVRHLVVVDEQGKVIGMLSDRDIRQAIGNPLRIPLDGPFRASLAALTVAEVMTDQPVTVVPDAELAQVARLLADERFGAVPVVDPAERLVGIISYVDLLQVLTALASPPARVFDSRAQPAPR